MLDVLFDQQYQEEAMRKDSFREGKEEGRSEGLTEGKIDALCRMINGGLTEDFIVGLGYTRTEYSNALKKLAA